MRLWHQKLIPYLNRPVLLNLYQYVCRLRCSSWPGTGHGLWDPVEDRYIFTYEPARLYSYHLLVMDEMMKYGFNPDWRWYNRLYRGDRLPPFTLSEAGIVGVYIMSISDREMIYPEHDDRYLARCLEDLAASGAELVNGGSLSAMRLELAAKGVDP